MQLQFQFGLDTEKKEQKIIYLYYCAHVNRTGGQREGFFFSSGLLLMYRRMKVIYSSKFFDEKLMCN